MRKPKLAITCNVGWVYRNVFLTGIISELEKHFCILVLCNEVTRPLVKAALRDSSAECLVVDVSQNYLAAKLRSLLSAILVMRDSPRYGAYRYSPSNLGIFLLKYSSILVPILEKIYLVILRLFCSDKNLKEILTGVETILFMSPYGIDDHIVYVHAPSDVKKINWILSWDNVFSKGLLLKANLYFIWADFMREPLRKLGIAEDSIKNIEVPHLGGGKLNSTEKNTIVYSCNYGGHYPDELNLVRKLTHLYSTDLYQYFDGFIVRTHPAGPNKIFDSLADSSKDISVSHPSSVKEESLYKWTPGEGELDDLAKVLCSARININVASTMSIDAASHGAEVLNIGFHEDSAFDEIVKSYYEFEHYKIVVDIGLVDLALNFEALRDKLLKSALDNSVRRQEVSNIFREHFDNSKSNFHKIISALTWR